MLKYESLHNHTTDSDGLLTPLELLKLAEQSNFGVIAITDHDTVPSARRLAELRAYAGSVKWFVGCEISSGLPKELGGQPASMFHILGLFVDPTNQALQDHCRQAMAARKTRMKKIVANLHGLELRITVDDCLEVSKGEAVGRPHIVQALLKYPENLEIIEALRQKMETAAVGDPKLGAKYTEMMRRTVERDDLAQQPFFLFLSADSFIPNIYVDYEYWTDFDQSVKLIRDAGGVAILAHWPTIQQKIDLSLLRQIIKDGRLDGLEVRTGFIGIDTPQTEKQLREIVEETHCLSTIGIDLHGREDMEHFLAQKELVAETVGQTQRLIDQIKPDLRCSNL